MGGSLVLTYITTGVTNPQCGYKDTTGNAVIRVGPVEYMLKSVNPFPTFEPTTSVEEDLLSEVRLGVGGLRVEG